MVLSMSVHTMYCFYLGSLLKQLCYRYNNTTKFTETAHVYICYQKKMQKND